MTTTAQQREYVARFVKKYFDAMGEPVSNDVFAGVDAAIAKRKETLGAAATRGKLDAPAGKDAGVEKAMVTAYAGNKGINIQRAFVSDAVWKINRNDLGVILNRYKTGTVLVKAKDGGYCAAFPSTVGQAYSGGGSYTSHYEVDQNTTGTVVKCK